MKQRFQDSDILWLGYDCSSNAGLAKMNQCSGDNSSTNQISSFMAATITTHAEYHQDYDSHIQDLGSRSVLEGQSPMPQKECPVRHHGSNVWQERSLISLYCV